MITEESISGLRRDSRTNSRLRFGVPNQGRLLNQVRAALAFSEWTQDTRCLNFAAGDVEAVLARSTDLPRLVAAGVLDGCITGRDYVVEAGVEERLEEVLDLDFQATNICVVARSSEPAPLARDRLTVVSQYPAIARRWLDERSQQGLIDNATFVAIDGAAEMYVRSGLADLAIDAVMTGRSLRDNDMVVVETLFASTGRVYSRGERLLGAKKHGLLSALASTLADGTS
ncbi:MULTISPECIES: ATP phosphoribosyltransferase [unclassified Microbacterium]|uniref:ATP phosphoribosyltransferase n=1 Tax=unclassified Microbacterium TaxID=2609290 RepID=UPI001604E5F2|nr:MULTISPECIES: ATP phosphoribosyltransferase [unclassified Microbacterium]QNA91333.1 ATP phosphoribosyltransferase [Microbacterium sp. Se63.02b]QYM64492.1 ATP phosphoribosyltransferase [Microbacterium sp. Se5.02b]